MRASVRIPHLVQSCIATYQQEGPSGIRSCYEHARKSELNEVDNWLRRIHHPIIMEPTQEDRFVSIVKELASEENVPMVAGYKKGETFGEYSKEEQNEIEKEQVAQVFGLTGGELEDEPWKGGFGYWYEGVPSYVEREVTRKIEKMGYRWDATVRTGIVFGGGYLTKPEKELTDAEGHVWKLVEVYTNSGEVECPWQGRDENIVVPEHCWREHRDCNKCPLCEERMGEEHGYINVGEGYEAVYVLAEEDSDDEGSEDFEGYEGTELKRIKRIRSHAGHAQFLAEVDDNFRMVIKRPPGIPSPYSYSPEWPVYLWRGQRVIIRETAHRQFDVFALPADYPVFEPEE